MRIIDIIDDPKPVVPTEGIIYSTDPRVASTQLGKCYVKDNDIKIVFAEAVCYSIATRVGLNVPKFTLCRDTRDSSIWFGSCEIPLRSPVDRMIENNKVSNLDILPETIVFDTWVFNVDRNQGNFVACLDPFDANKLKYFAIDFEKSLVCRGKPSVELTTLSLSDCWPKGPLEKICARFKVPNQFVKRIMDIDNSEFEKTVEEFGTILSIDEDTIRNCIYNLKIRQSQLPKLIKEVWRQ